MAIDISTENLIDLKAICRLPVFRNGTTGKPCNFSKAWRLVTYGARDANGQRVVLETVRTPSGLRTSMEAVERFIHRLTDPIAATVPQTRTPARRQREHDRAVKNLVEAGIMETADDKTGALQNRVFGESCGQGAAPRPCGRC